jgi:trigger factor
MKNTITTSPDGTIEFTITIPWADIQNTYKTVVTETASNAEIAGFRKGKAPKQMVEENIDKTKTYEETIKRLVPKAYTDAVQEHKIAPILMPQVELKDAQEGKDWVISAKTCERPKVTLKDYKKAINDLKAEKTKKIFVPGKDNPSEEKPKGPTVDEVLERLLTAVEASIPDILLEHEVTHQLSLLVDQTKKLGLTVDQYLASTGKTADSIREEYKSMAAKNLTLEFALEAISEKEQVVASEEEVTKVIQGAKTDEERKNLENQRYYLTSLIRRQKTLDTLMA